MALSQLFVRVEKRRIGRRGTAAAQHRLRAGRELRAEVRIGPGEEGAVLALIDTTVAAVHESLHISWAEVVQVTPCRRPVPGPAA